MQRRKIKIAQMCGPAISEEIIMLKRLLFLFSVRYFFYAEQRLYYVTVSLSSAINQVLLFTVTFVQTSTKKRNSPFESSPTNRCSPFTDCAGATCSPENRGSQRCFKGSEKTGWSKADAIYLEREKPGSNRQFSNLVILTFFPPKHDLTAPLFSVYFVDVSP